MSLPFIIIAVVTLSAAAAAMSLRNLVHCALSLVVALAGKLLFGEKMHPLSWAGVAIGILAVILLGASAS